MYEYHTHTTNSPDSRVKMREYCERAIAIGIQEVAFTDHIDHAVKVVLENLTRAKQGTPRSRNP